MEPVWNMRVEVPFGEEIIKAEIDESHVSGIFGGNDVAASDETETVLRAIDNPVNSVNLRDFMAGAGDVVFIVNDATRPTPTARVLETVYEIIKPFDIRFLVATGAHRPPTDEEYRQIFGRFFEEFKPHIYAHNSRSDGDMVYITKSRNGTEVYLNRMVAEARKIVVISSVEPHYFAGYTGGRKSILPGVASYRTIEQNHRLALSDRARALALDGNPVHEDMKDTLTAIKDKKIFSIMTVLDKNQRIYAAAAGDIDAAFMAAVYKAREVYVVRLREKADIVVAVARHPLDIDLYQSQKAIENGKLALKDGGILILVSKCRCGVGDESFLNLLAACTTHGEVFKKIEKGYKLGYHKAAKMAELRQWADIYSITSLPEQLIRSAFMTPFPSLQAALNHGLRIKGSEAKVLFLLDGAVTVPSFE
jgi:nickel-dependent lactate racemase